jgi:pyroglutamyl-peptidase
MVAPKHPVLVTGFEPFGGEALNPSARVAQALHGRTIDGVPVIGAVLPCVFGAAIDALRDALERHRPQLVLALGQAAGRSALSLERVAINVDDARIPDNAGVQPVDTPVVAKGPAAHFTTLPVKAMVAALRAAGHPAELSHSAGTFVCNHVFYGLQHALRARRSARSGFMHLPLLPEQARAGQPSLALAAMIDGTALALATALRLRSGDLHASEGALD